MLHVMLRMGLLDDLKDISGHKYDSIKDFNKLRQLENDYKNRTKPITAKSAPSDQDELLELKVKTTHCYMEKHQQKFRENNFRFILKILCAGGT